MKSLIYILIFGIFYSCSHSPNEIHKEEAELFIEDSLGIATAFYEKKPFTGVIINFQGYFVANYLKDSLAFTTGRSFYSEGRLDSVHVDFLNEKRYFNGDNMIDSTYIDNKMIVYFTKEVIDSVKTIKMIK